MLMSGASSHGHGGPSNRSDPPTPICGGPERRINIPHAPRADSMHIGIPEGALDVKRALTGRAIFSRPEAEFWSVACRTRDAQGHVEEDPPGFPNRLLIRADGLSSARWVPKIARRRAAVKGGRRPSRRDARTGGAAKRSRGPERP